ncbi:MAG: hypothetical protein M0015_01995 [Betaproteobacteria bacterium]|nr:hypothetical protein [Betaproteobacteria bacterium]
MCYDWWDESLRQERIKLAREEADTLKRAADRQAPPQGTEPKPKTDPDRQTQPDAVPV